MYGNNGPPPPPLWSHPTHKDYDVDNLEYTQSLNLHNL